MEIPLTLRSVHQVKLVIKKWILKCLVSPFLEWSEQLNELNGKGGYRSEVKDMPVFPVKKHGGGQASHKRNWVRTGLMKRYMLWNTRKKWKKGLTGLYQVWPRKMEWSLRESKENTATVDRKHDRLLLLRYNKEQSESTRMWSREIMIVSSSDIEHYTYIWTLMNFQTLSSKLISYIKM